MGLKVIFRSGLYQGAEILGDYFLGLPGREDFDAYFCHIAAEEFHGKSKVEVNGTVTHKHSSGVEVNFDIDYSGLMVGEFTVEFPGFGALNFAKVLRDLGMEFTRGE